jgi:Na+-driven multidrug efflux pump
MIYVTWRAGIRLHLARPFPFQVMREILRVGIPGAGDNIAYSSANVCIMFLMTGLGTTALASYTLANNLIGFVQMSGYSVGQSAQIMVGRLVGAGDANGAYRLGLRTTRLALAMNLSVMAVVMVLQRPILSLFTKNPEILAIVFWILIVDIVLEFGRPLNLVLGCCIRGSGDVRWAIGASVLSIACVLIPLAFVFTRVIPLGVPGILIAYCIDEWLRGVLMTWRWRSRRWEKSALVRQIAPERSNAQVVTEAGS